MTTPTLKNYIGILRGDIMKMIANIIEDIRGELDGAEEYAKKAAEYKEKDRSLSSTYSTAATQELSHVDAFHAQVVRVIQDYRSTGKEVPEGMQAVYDWEHEKMIDRVSRIKMLLELARK